jgi:FdhE protein
MSATTQTPIIPIKSSSEPPHVIAPDARRFFQPARCASTSSPKATASATGCASSAPSAAPSTLALQALPALELPDAKQLALAREHRMPPLPAQSWPRDPAWRTACNRSSPPSRRDAPDPRAMIWRGLPPSTPSASKPWPSACCTPSSTATDAALLPYVAAALQVLWTAGAARLGVAEIAALDVPGVCPCCGFLPVASVVRGGGEVANLRYLHCALCNTEWNLVRVKCTACDATEGVSYRHRSRRPARAPTPCAPKPAIPARAT